jgi:preprotein translocase subunit SecE
VPFYQLIVTTTIVVIIVSVVIAVIAIASINHPPSTLDVVLRH